MELGSVEAVGHSIEWIERKKSEQLDDPENQEQPPTLKYRIRPS